MNNFHVRISALFGFTGVGLGAFGAHGLQSVLLQNGTAQYWQTASLYHLIHGVALLALALHRPTVRLTFWLWTAGILIFSGSLYVLAFTNLRWLGAITPIGGTCLLAGWLWLALRRVPAV